MPVARTHEMDDFGQYLLDLGQIRRERIAPFLERGRVAGRWIGEHLGYLLAGVGFFAFYYVPIWLFTGLWFLGRFLAAKFDEDIRESEAERQRIPLRLRLKIAREQEWRCYYGNKAPIRKHGFHIDHLVPKAAGGTDERSNLVASCPKHNSEKSDKDLDEFLVWMEEHQEERCYTKNWKKLS